MATGIVRASMAKRGSQVPSFEAKQTAQPLSDWVDVCTAPETTDNSGSAVVAPLGITRADQNWFDNEGFGQTVLVRLKYDDDVGTPTNPVVQLFGKDANGIPQKLLDGSGNHELTLTVTTASDVTDGTWKYTPATEVNMRGDRFILAAIKTAFAASSGTVNNSTIQMKVK